MLSNQPLICLVQNNNQIIKIYYKNYFRQVFKYKNQTRLFIFLRNLLLYVKLRIQYQQNQKLPSINYLRYIIKSKFITYLFTIKRGLINKTISHLEESLKIKTEIYGLKNNLTLLCLMNLGKLYLKKKKYEMSNEKYSIAI